MLPTVNTYGPWPVSGEIDIVEARGNAISYPRQGSNVVRGSLNWGPLTWINKVSLTYGWWSMRRASYGSEFHTYTLEWTDKFLRIYVDTRLHHMMDIRFNIPFFQRGQFPPVVQNGSDYIALKNPWANGTMAAPFDHKFYLILNVAVGGTNGWFPDGAGDKPWLDGSSTAMRDFAMSRDKWYPTWSNNDDRAMIVDYVKMWEVC
jgi:beta-glucanase (GH16 family)